MQWRVGWGASSSKADIDAAQRRQSIVNGRYLQLMKWYPPAKVKLFSPPGADPGETVQTYNGWLFSDRNDDGDMDMAEYVSDGEVFINLRSGTDFDSSWESVSSSQFLSFHAPPRPGNYPDNDHGN
jgi:hypothetical protein